MAVYKRVLLKLSGEALKTGSDLFDFDQVHRAAAVIRKMADMGTQIGIVIGAGNIWRGRQGPAANMDAVTADQMGMLGTVINCLCMADALRQAGVQDSHLRLIYVKARLQTPVGPQVQAHMVLAYYATPNAEPLVLDNLNPAILPAGKRQDLTPVFSFNSDGIYAGISGRDKAASGVGRLSRWADVLRRIAAEGLD